MRPKNFKELVKAAMEQPDLIGALASLGVELERSGNSRYGEHYRVKGTRDVKGVSDDFSSVVFCHNFDGTWTAFDNKERTGRKQLSAIGVLTDLFKCSFDQAVYLLTGTAPVESRTVRRPPKKQLPPPEPKPPEPFVLPEKRPQSSWKGKKYLTKDRLIPEPVVEAFFEQELIYMPTMVSPTTQKCFDCVGFKVRNENKEVVGLEADATFVIPGHRRFKQVLANSDQRYGFSFKNNVTEISSNTPIYFCESAVDAISMFCLQNLVGAYVSLSGLKDTLLLHMTQTLGGKPVICTDNDEAGNRFREKFGQYETLLPEYGKDWNEELQYRICKGMDYALKDESALTPEDIHTFLRRQQTFCRETVKVLRAQVDEVRVSDLVEGKKQEKLNALAGQIDQWEKKSRHYAGLEADFLERNQAAPAIKQGESVSARI